MGEDFKSTILQHICLFGVLRPTRQFGTHGDVTITDEGHQILTFLRTHGHGAVRVLWRSTPNVTRVIRL